MEVLEEQALINIVFSLIKTFRMSVFKSVLKSNWLKI